MKLLFDENISYRIVKKVVHAFPESEQVKRLQLMSKKDRVVWEFARQHDFAIVSHDEDYAELSFYHGFPPKVIWLRTGNISTDDLAGLLLSHADMIHRFLVDIGHEASGCLELYPLAPDHPSI
jgi:predicted nuclease of predicted toxin-antitoxin system